MIYVVRKQDIDTTIAVLFDKFPNIFYSIEEIGREMEIDVLEIYAILFIIYEKARCKSDNNYETIDLYDMISWCEQSASVFDQYEMSMMLTYYNDYYKKQISVYNL